MKTPSIDHQIKTLHEAGHSIRSIASQLEIDKSKVQRILKRLQEESFLESDTNDDTLFNTDDTSVSSVLKSTSDTRDTPHAGSFDTGLEVEFDTNPPKKTAVSIKKTYSMAELKHLMLQISLFQQGFNEFVSQMLTVHNGQQWIGANEYRNHSKKVNRMIQSAKILADQIEELPENLLVIKVLESIQKTIQDVVSGRDKVTQDYKYYYLTDRIRALQFWQDAIGEDFFTHSS